MIVLREHRLDDLTEMESDDITRVDFPANGQMYSLDLNEENAANLMELLTTREHAMKRADEEYRATLADIEMEHATRTAKYVEAAQRVTVVTKSSKRGRPAVGRPIVPERVKRAYNRKAPPVVVPPPAAPAVAPTVAMPIGATTQQMSPDNYLTLPKSERPKARAFWAKLGNPTPPRLPDAAVAAYRASLVKPDAKPAKKAAGKAAGKAASKPPVATFSGAE